MVFLTHAGIGPVMEKGKKEIIEILREFTHGWGYIKIYTRRRLLFEKRQNSNIGCLPFLLS